MKSSKGSTRKNAAGNRLDIGWKHGIDVDGNSKKVQCKYCNKTFSSGIYRFKHHLAGSHSNVESCLAVPDEVKQEIRSILDNLAQSSVKKRKDIYIDINDEVPEEIDQSQSQGKGKDILGYFGKKTKQTTMNQMMKNELREEICQQIARFFYTSAIPFNCVKNPEFIKIWDLVGRYGIGFKPPTYHEIRVKYLKKEYKKTVEDLEVYKKEWKTTGCSIMSDGWSDKKRRSICNFLVNSPKGTVFLSSLDTSSFSKTKENVFEMLDAIVEQVGEDNVVQVITDNAANYKAAGELLMEKRKKLFWTPCAAHCIDLILEDFEKKLDVHKDTIAKARRIATYIYSKQLLISILRQFTKGRDLVRPAATRFATAYLTLGCLSELKMQLMTMFSSKTWANSRFATTQDGKNVRQIVMDSVFWRNVLTCLKAAFPLIKVLRMVDSEKQPAMGFLYKEMDCAKVKIRANFNEVKKNYNPILKIIDGRWELQLHRPLHAAAYYLNPHFHYSSDFIADADIKIGLYTCLERMVPDPKLRWKIDMQIDKFKKADSLFGIDNARMSRTTKPPADWWESFGAHCLELQKFAIRILSLTCSSSGCERNWSAFEMVHTKKRNRLQQKRMNDLVFIMFNLKLKDRKFNKCDELSFEDLSSDDEWVTEENDHESSSLGGDDWLDDEEVDVNVENEVLQSHEKDDDLEIHDLDVDEEIGNDKETGNEDDLGSDDEANVGCDNEAGDMDDEDSGGGGRFKSVNDYY